MQITDNRAKTDTTFGMLRNGDVFFSPADDEYYMKITPVENEMEGERNAVCLSSGVADVFYTCDKIEKVCAELIIS